MRSVRQPVLAYAAFIILLYGNAHPHSKGRYKGIKKMTKRTKHIITDHAHAVIKRTYQTSTGNGEVRDMAKSLGLPRWKISRYAILNGWVATNKKEPNWSKKELRILESAARHCPKVIQGKLKKAGHSRSETGIVLKRKRMRFLKNLNGQSATMLAGCFNADGHVITRAIQEGRLKAKRRGTKRTAKQGGDSYFIKNKDVKNYIIENLNEIDIRKVDKYWFVDILTS